MCASVPTTSSLAAVRRDAPTLADQIMVFPGALSDPHCQQLIDRFEACDGLEACHREGGHSFTQLNITRAWPDEHERLLAVFIAHFNQYQEFLPRLGIFALLISGAAAIYLALAWALRCREISEVYGIAVHGEHEPVGAAGMLP